MKTVLIIGSLLSIVLMAGCIKAVEYGLTGIPKMNLIAPACNSTVSSNPTFTFEPQPTPYHHYKLQIKAGDSWDIDNTIVIDDITETSFEFTTLNGSPLGTGDYLYNVIGYDESGESRAGSGPCKFTVE